MIRFELSLDKCILILFVAFFSIASSCDDFGLEYYCGSLCAIDEMPSAKNEQTCKLYGGIWQRGYCRQGNTYIYGDPGCADPDQTYEGEFCLINEVPNHTYATESACLAVSGKWHTGVCKFVLGAESNCLAAGGRWYESGAADLGNGHYMWRETPQSPNIWEHSTYDYYCGTYNDLIGVEKGRSSCHYQRDAWQIAKGNKCVLVPFYILAELGTDPRMIMSSQCIDRQVQCIGVAGCVDIVSDPQNCGFCGNACGTDAQGMAMVCRRGRCESAMPE